MNKFLYKSLLISCVIWALQACSDSDKKAQADQSSEIESSPVLAEVNGDPITQADVDFLIERTFSNTNQLFFDEQMQAKVLDSLIAAKAMKQQIEGQLSADELMTIQQKINAYGEELFVKEYLSRNATPEPVSTQMVQDYYLSHQEEFGGGESKSIEMLKTATKPSEQQRDLILTSIDSIKQNDNWAEFANANGNKLGLSFYQSKVQPGLFAPQIENAIKPLLQGEVSNVVIVDGVPHILKVTEVEPLAAKPLSSVSAEIRKKLAALQLKKAVKKASDDVVQQATVKRSQ